MDESAEHGTVLILDQDAERRQRNACLLGQAKFAVHSVGTADMALRMLQEFRPDIVVMSLMIQTLRGVELCSAIRRKPDGLTLSIVLLLSEDDSATRLEAYRAGADDVLHDAIPPEEFLLRIGRLWDRCHGQAQLTQQDRIDTVFRVAHTIRHGINNPMQVIELGLDMLGDKLEADREASEFLRKMSGNVMRVKQLMDRLAQLTELRADPTFGDPNILDVFDREAQHVKRLRERGAYRVLVVEDDAGQRLALTSVLARSGRFVIEEAGSGDQALEMAKHDPPDVLLTDVNMPGLSGFDLCARIKDDPELAHIVVIMLTVRQSFGDLLRAHELGAANFLLKPIDPGRLVEHVYRTLGHHGYAEVGRT